MLYIYTRQIDNCLWEQVCPAGVTIYIVAESFCYKDLQLKVFCLCVICSYPSAENIRETTVLLQTTAAVLKHLWVRVFGEGSVTGEFKVPDDYTVKVQVQNKWHIIEWVKKQSEL